MQLGWIKLHRQFIKWEWYSNSTVKNLFIHLLLKANHEDKKWQGKLIKKGSLITSYPHLADELGFSIQNIRTALNKLKSTGELTVKTTSKYSYVSITNYDDYQATNSLANSQLTVNQQATNSQLTTNKNVKNVKNDKKESGKHLPKENELKESEFVEIANKYNVPVGFVKTKWDDVMNYCHANDKRYSDFKRTLMNWVKRDKSKVKLEKHQPVNQANLDRINEMKKEFGMI